ncbi:MAG TPA: GNAT family N-acetyltransferase [Ignavibacteriales bacterium]|nr:GNAT family N-acetyltransferase [Ignavibacteriales bacterium]
MPPVIRGLKKPSELKKLYSFYPKVFKKTPLDFFVRRIENDPYLQLGDIRIAEENNEIASSITVVRRKMYWGSENISFGGIGNVSSLPEKRGTGIASAVMNDAIEYMKGMDLNVSILFTGINPFYEKFRFVTVPAHIMRFEMLKKYESEYTVRNFSYADLEKVSAIYKEFNADLFGPVVRDTAYWKANLKFAEPDEIFLVAEKSGGIEGYIRLVPPNSRNEIWEFGFTNINAFKALISEAAGALNKSELRTEALCPLGLLNDTDVFKISYEPSTIAMALLAEGGSLNASLKYGFSAYCFWWTDNF